MFIRNLFENRHYPHFLLNFLSSPKTISHVIEYNYVITSILLIARKRLCHCPNYLLDFVALLISLALNEIVTSCCHEIDGYVMN